MDTILLIATALLVLGLSSLAVSWPGLRDKRLPPGPPTLPFLGNLLAVPKTGVHLKYTKWAKFYGSKFSLKIGQGTMVVLSSAVDAGRMMDKRSLHYSDRPPSHIIGDLVFRGDHPMFMNADDRWKLRRKLYHQMFNENRCNKEHLTLVEAESSQLVHDLALNPEGLMLHPGRYSNSITSSLVLGIRTPTYDADHYLKLRNMMTDLITLGEIGQTPPVDIMPIFKYMPGWLWGDWKARARRLRKTAFDLYGPLVDQVVERRAMGKTLNSFLDGVLDQEEGLGLSRDAIIIMCGNLLEGGTDTMATLILTLCQALALHPHVQKEVHEHIDGVLDGSKMPTWADYERLPYIAMLVKELQRWRPPAPAAFPHALDRDDEIDGMRVPKGSAVVLNVWGIHHDAKHYEDPEVFNPHRFESQTQLAPVYANSGDYEKRDHFGYGIGRRICPGIHLAERALWMAVARIVWAFDIRPKLDANGKPIPINVSPESGYTDGFLNQCRPFEADIKIRSEQRLKTIMEATSKARTEIFSSYS